MTSQEHMIRNFRCSCTDIVHNFAINYINGVLIVKTTIINFSYFEISNEMGTLLRVLFNQRLKLFF